LSLLIIIGGIILLSLGLVARQSQTELRGLRWLGYVFGSIFIVFGIISSMLVIIPTGWVGVIRTGGVVQPGVVQPGPAFVFPPFWNTIEEVETRVVGHPFEDLGAASKEYQDVFLTGVLNTHISPQNASRLIGTVSDIGVDSILIPAFKDVIKEIVPQYSVNDVLPKRDTIRAQTKERLQAAVEKYGIVVDDVFLANIDFNQEFKDAIERKQIAYQDTLTEQQKVEISKAQANQNVEKAKGEAAAQIETAKGDAQSRIERANGEATANKALAESLSDAVLEWTRIQKLNPKVQVIYLPTDGNYILPLQPTASAAPAQ